MANLISAVTGVFTAAGTWGTVDATSELDSEANSTAISTTPLDSSASTTGAITCDGIALKLAARAASPSGTFTCTLRNSTLGADVTSVTVNVSDLPASGLGWVFFKFSAPQLLIVATNYVVRVVCSATGSQVTLYRDGTSNNWSRKLRTTTTQAPALNNQLVVCNQLTGAGASTAVTVTMDNTATTTWGPAIVGTQGVVVSGGGTLTWDVSASTSFYFKWRGIFQICGNGTVNVGTSGARMPATSSAVLEMSCVANNDSKLRMDAGGTLNIYGATKTTSTRLTVDAASTATNLTVTSTSGWQVADKLAFSPTGSSVSQHETKNVLTVNSGTTLTLSAGLTNAHSGTSPLQAYVINLTRNIKFQSDSASNKGNLYIPSAGGTATVDSCEFVLDTIGSNSGNNRPIDIQTTTNSATFIDCAGTPTSFGTGSNITALYVNGAGTINNFTITRWVSYNWLASHISFEVGNTVGANWSITGCVCIQSTDNSAMIQCSGTLGTFNNNVAICCRASSEPGIVYREGTTNQIFTMLDATRFDGNVVGYAAWDGFAIGRSVSNGLGVAFACQNCIAFRNTNSGFSFRNYTNRVLFTALTAFGNGTGSSQQGAIRFQVPGAYLMLSNCTLAGDTTVSSECGIRFTDDSQSGGGAFIVDMYNTTIGVASGIFTTFGTADLSMPYPSQDIIQIYANSCKFGSATIFQNLTSANQQRLGDHVDRAGSYLRAQKYQQVAGDHRTFASQGTIAIDTTIFNTASPSQRITPNTASYKVRSGPKQIPISSGAAVTVGVYIRKSSAGDGAAYTGAQPRLIVRRNDSIGISADTVLATYSAGTGAWNQISGATVSATADGVIEVYVDGDGTTGWLNCDDWSFA